MGRWHDAVCIPVDIGGRDCRDAVCVNINGGEGEKYGKNPNGATGISAAADGSENGGAAMAMESL